MAEIKIEPDSSYDEPTGYEEHHFKTQVGAGIAWTHDRVWFCVDGLSVLRACVRNGKLFIDYGKPDCIEELER